MKLWIARDDNGLFLFKEKPIEVYLNGIGYCYELGDEICQLKDDIFPEVTYKNSPRQVEINYVMNGL